MYLSFPIYRYSTYENWNSLVHVLELIMNLISLIHFFSFQNNTWHVFLRPLLYSMDKRHRYVVILLKSHLAPIEFMSNVQPTNSNNSEMWHKLLLINDTITVSLCYRLMIKWQYSLYMRILGNTTNDTTKLVGRETQTVC